MKRELIYSAVVGGVVGAVLVMAAGSFSPLRAQNEVADAEFGTITCRRLVVRYDGIRLATEIDPSFVKVQANGRSARLHANGVSVLGENGKGRAAITVMGEHGNVSLSGEDGEGSVYMTVDDRGGYVSVRSKEGEGSAHMALNENGGYVGVFGKGSETTRAIMAVNEYGNGAVSTWDKNGYRLQR